MISHRSIKPPAPNETLSPEQQVRWDVIIGAIGIGVILLDQISKAIVMSHFSGARRFDVVPIFGSVLSLIFVQNNGAAFSLFEGLGVVYIFIAAAVGVIGYLYLRFRPRNHPWLKVTFGLILGGAIGNVIDRVRLGYVVDFIHFQIPGHFDWPVFNIADSSIVIGMLSLIAIFVLLPRESEPSFADDAPPTGGTPARDPLERTSSVAPRASDPTGPAAKPTSQSVAAGPRARSVAPTARSAGTKSVATATRVSVKSASKARRKHR